MAVSIFSLVPENRVDEVLSNLQSFTDLNILLIDEEGKTIKFYGKEKSYCAFLQGKAFDKAECNCLHIKSGERARSLGESYIFTCHANLHSIAFPLINQSELLGTVIIGPFLINKPDSTIVSDVAERYHLNVSSSLDLYEELSGISILSSKKANELKILVDHLLSPLLPGERALLLETQKKMSQQAKINETIQIYKEQTENNNLNYFNTKEKLLLDKVRSGSSHEVKAIFNELIGHVVFSEGSNIESIRIYAIELATLLSRVAIDGGARSDSIYRLNSQFIGKLYEEGSVEDVCMMMQEVLDSFMSAMFSEADKGNPYIRKALRFMNDNYSEHLDLAQVADHVELSPGYFSTLFHDVVGVSFRDELCKIRVEASKHLLLLDQYPLADIAVAVGFPDQSYYCKVFKKFVGVTPRKYKG